MLSVVLKFLKGESHLESLCSKRAKLKMWCKMGQEEKSFFMFVISACFHSEFIEFYFSAVVILEINEFTNACRF